MVFRGLLQALKQPEAHLNMIPSAPPNISNPFVFTKKTPFMQRIADLVRSGHTQYMNGVIPVEKAGFFAQKMEAQFQTNRSKVEACRARKRGEGSARLLFLHQGQERLLIWILLYQVGNQPDQTESRWRDALEDKIVLTGYELVRQTRPGATKPAWSWRYSHTQYERLRDQIIQSIRGKRDDVLRQLIHSIARSPGFAGVRDQVKNIFDLIKSEWKRRRAKTEQCPVLPKHGYTRRVEDHGCRLTELRDQIKLVKVRTSFPDAAMPNQSAEIIA